MPLPGASWCNLRIIFKAHAPTVEFLGTPQGPGPSFLAGNFLDLNTGTSSGNYSCSDSSMGLEGLPDISSPFLGLHWGTGLLRAIWFLSG